MADSRANRHIGDQSTGANAKSPITLAQMCVWLSLATFSVGGMFLLPPLVAPMPVELAPQQISQLKTGAISPVVSSPGITILRRSQPGSPAPVASGADTASGFAISLGEAGAFSTLSGRFERIAEMNPALFQNLEPRALFVDTSTGLSARLLAGPFESNKEASIICGILKLPGGIICKTQAFDGDLISRQ